MAARPGHGLLQPEACEFAVSLTEEEDISLLPEIDASSSCRMRMMKRPGRI